MTTRTFICHIASLYTTLHLIYHIASTSEMSGLWNFLVRVQSSLIKLNLIQSWSTKFLKITSPIQSWSASEKSRILFCLMRQKNYWSYFALSQMWLVEGKIVPAVLLPHEEKSTQLLAFTKFNKDVSIWHQEEKHCWTYFAIWRIRLLGLVKWQRWYSWISIKSLLHDLKP